MVAGRPVFGERRGTSFSAHRKRYRWQFTSSDWSRDSEFSKNVTVHVAAEIGLDATADRGWHLRL
jgi:hypothetical protein